MGVVWTRTNSIVRWRPLINLCALRTAYNVIMPTAHGPFFARCPLSTAHAQLARHTANDTVIVFTLTYWFISSIYVAPADLHEGAISASGGLFV